MRNSLTGMMLVGAALIATTAFAQGGGVVLPNGVVLPSGGNQNGTLTPSNLQSIAMMRALSGGRHSHGAQSGFNPNSQQTTAQQAYAQQQNAVAAAKAAKEQERRDKIKATIIAQRDKEQTKRGKSPATAPASAAPVEPAGSFGTPR